MGYNLLINGVYWGYNPFTNHLLTSCDIQVGFNKANIPPNAGYQWNPFCHTFVSVNDVVFLGVTDDWNKSSDMYSVHLSLSVHLFSVYV